MQKTVRRACHGSISHKQLELMAKYMTELGLTPASRSRLAIQMHTGPKPWEFGYVESVTRIIIEPDDLSLL